MKEKIVLYAPPFSHIKTYKDMVDVAVEYGISYIEPLNILDLSKPDLKKAEEINEYIKKNGLSVPCFSAGINLVGDDSEIQTENLKRYADIAKLFGSPYLHHTVAFNFSDPDSVLSQKEVLFQKGIKAAREVNDYCNSIGIKAIYEEQGFIFNGLDGYERFITELDRDYGVVADFGNILFCDDTFEDFLTKFSGHVVHVHLKDYSILKNGTFDEKKVLFKTKNHNGLLDAPLGKGSIDYDKAFSILKKIGYDGYYSIECPPIGPDEEKTFKENIEVLRGHIGNM